MRSSIAAAGGASLLLWLAGSALAASEGHAEAAHHGPSWSLLALQILNTAILLAVLIYAGRRPIQEFFARRRREIQESIEGARSELEAAERRLQELGGRLEGIDRDRARLLADAEEIARAEELRSQERARRAAERIREEAGRVADQELDRARRALRGEAAALATELAAERLKQAITPEDDRRLIGEFIGRTAGPS